MIQIHWGFSGKLSGSCLFLLQCSLGGGVEWDLGRTSLSPLRSVGDVMTLTVMTHLFWIVLVWCSLVTWSTTLSTMESNWSHPVLFHGTCIACTSSSNLAVSFSGWHVCGKSEVIEIMVFRCWEGRQDHPEGLRFCHQHLICTSGKSWWHSQCLSASWGRLMQNDLSGYRPSWLHPPVSFSSNMFPYPRAVMKKIWQYHHLATEQEAVKKMVQRCGTILSINSR